MIDHKVAPVGGCGLVPWISSFRFAVPFFFLGPRPIHLNAAHAVTDGQVWAKKWKKEKELICRSLLILLWKINAGMIS